MRKLIVTSIALVLLTSGADAGWKSVSLEERVRRADLIVVGTLQEVKERGLSITFDDQRYIREGLVIHYDTGVIQVSIILKGEVRGDRVLFASYGGAGVVGNSEITADVSTMHSLKVSEGDSGIWILSNGGAFVPGHFTVDYPGNPLPYDSLSAVNRVLDEKPR